MQDLLAQSSFDKLKEGSIVPGVITEIRQNEVVVDIGGKSEGLIPANEFIDIGELQIGSTIEVLVQKLEGKDGAPILSFDLAEQKKNWENILTKFPEGSVATGRVKAKVKGGLIVSIGVDAFMPASHIDVQPPKNLDQYVGQTYDFKVLKINLDRKNIVLSRRELIEEQRTSKRRNLLESIQPGQIRKGVVKNITDFGAFIDLDGMDGLLHITDMSWGRLTHPRDLVNVGDEIQVKVLKFDKDKQRVSLGFKQLTPDPWLDATERYPVGAHVHGRVLSVTDYGAFVELEQGIEGLVHLSEMTWSKRLKHPSKMVKPGDEVETVVLNVNPADRRISLGMKQLLENPWENLADRYPAGTIVEGRVRNLTDFGAFIEIEDGIDGLVHVSNLSWTKRVKHPSEVVKKGEKVKAVVLGVEPQNRRLSLGIKQLQPDVWESFFAAHRVGDVVHGKVLRTAQFGAFVEIAEGVEGLCHISEAGEGEEGASKLDVGLEHEFKIIKINVEEKKVGLSLRAVGQEASRAVVESYKAEHKHQVSSSTTTLGDLINWKSNS